MTLTSQVGHLRLSDRGEMLHPDSGFCALMRMTPRELVGRSVLDVTAPAQRATCRSGMTALRETGRAFVVTKQMVRSDGSAVWVAQTTARSTLFDRDTAVLATFVRVAGPAATSDVAALLVHARFLAQSRIERDTMLGGMLLANPSWDLLLATYIAEAEGRVCDAPTLAAATHAQPGVARRWLRALVTEGMLEIEDTADAPSTQRYRLSGRTHDRLEQYLARRLIRLGATGVTPLG